MARYLSAEWFAAVTEVLAGRALGAPLSVRLECVALAGPDGDVAGHVIVEDGVLVAVGPGGIPEADLTVSAPYADAVAMGKGALEPSVAFMQGRLKTAGDNGKVLDILALTRSEVHRAWQAELVALTEF